MIRACSLIVSSLMAPDSPPTGRNALYMLPRRRRLALSVWAVLAVPALAGAQDSSPWGCRANTEASGWLCTPEPEVNGQPFEVALGVPEPGAPSATSPVAAAPVATPRTLRADRNDWVPLTDVPDALRDARCERCGGRYIDPLADVDRSQPPEAEAIEATAADSELRSDIVQLFGGIEVTQGYRRLTAERGEFDTEKRYGELEGNVTLREPGLLLRGSRAAFFSQTGEAIMDEANFVLHDLHVRGGARQLARDEDGMLRVTDGSYTYCAPDGQGWLLDADAIDLNLEEGYATARGARIRVGGVPVVYTPWLRFPIDDSRRTGFLFPNIGTESDGGLDISVPFYWNLAPNYDVTLLPRYIANRGLAQQANARYLSEDYGLWELGGAYLTSDSKRRNEFPERTDDRWLASVNHDNLRGRIRSHIDYTKVSDEEYIKDLGNTILDERRQTHLAQTGTLDYLGDRWLVAARVEQYQALGQDLISDYRKLPQVSARLRSPSITGQVNPIAFTQYSYFDNQSSRFATGHRAYAEAGANYPLRNAWGFVTPTVKYRQVAYELDRLAPDQVDDAPREGAPLFSLDTGLIFERPFKLGATGMVQTLEPRLYYLYSGGGDQSAQPAFDSAELTFTFNQLYRETRFSGRDRIDDANQLTAGVTTRFVDASSGREYLSASVGQIFFRRDRKVRLTNELPVVDDSSSELAAELAFRPSNKFTLRSTVVWDVGNGSDRNNSLFQGQYRLDNGGILNAGYSFRRSQTTLPDTEQVDISTFLPVYGGWSLFARWRYGIKESTSIEDMFGFEYNSCCWRIRILHQRFFDIVNEELVDFADPNLERERATHVQIELKGLGGFGNRVSTLLTSLIRGFDDSAI